VKAGVRTLGVAESYRGDRSTLAGVVARADGVVDGVGFDTCTVGGSDATDTVVSIFRQLGREDVQYLLVAGIAPAWFNLLDLREIAAATDRPAVSVSFEDSPGLGGALRATFDGDALADRLRTYRAQPSRRRVSVGDETVFVRAVGVAADEAADVVRAFTPEGGRPEPLRVARFAARAADEAFVGGSRSAGDGPDAA